MERSGTAYASNPIVGALDLVGLGTGIPGPLARLLGTSGTVTDQITGGLGAFGFNTGAAGNVAGWGSWLFPPDGKRP